MILVGCKDDYELYFNCSEQMYTVFKNNKILISNKFKYSDVKSYLD